MMSIASCTRSPPARAWVNVSLSWLAFTPETGMARPAGPTSTPWAIATGGPVAGSTTATSPAGFTFRDSAVGSMPLLNANTQKALVRIAVTIAVAKTLNITLPVLSYELRLEARLHHQRQPHHVPVRHAQAAMA